MTTPLKLVAEPRRLEILRLIWDRERSVSEIADRLPVSIAAVSQHLAKLKGAGLVTVRQEGRRRFYRAHRGDMGTLAVYLESMWAERLERLGAMAEAAEGPRGADEADGPAGRDPSDPRSTGGPGPAEHPIHSEENDAP